MTGTTLDDPDLEAMTLDELEELGTRVTEEIDAKRVAAKAAVREDIEGILAEHGLQLADVFEELAPRKRGRRPSTAAADHGRPNGQTDM